MDINKGLFLDGYTGSKAHGGWEYAKNIMLADGFKGARPEKGFTELHNGDTLATVLTDLDWPHTVSNVTIVGHEYVKNYYLIFLHVVDSTNDNASAILKYDIIDSEYTMIMWDNGDNFYFHPDYPIDSVHTFSPSGDLIIAFCNGVDDVCIEPMLMNVDRRYEFYLNDDSSPKYFNLLYLFNRTEHIITDYTLLDEGELLPGVYYVTARFEYLDNTKTNWCMLTQPMKIGSNPDGLGNASIKIRGDYTGDYGYKSVDIAYIRKHEGQVYAYEYGNFNITSSYAGSQYTYKFDITITDESGSLVDLDSLLIRKAFYRKANSIEFVRNKLHLGGIKEENVLVEYQTFANDIIVSYNEELYEKTGLPMNTLGPGEVYALYTYFILKGSGVIVSPFNIPGREDYFANDVNFRDFESYHGGTLATSPTITPTFDFSDFPTDKRLKVEYINYESGSEEVQIITGTLDMSTNFMVNLRAEIDDAITGYGWSFTTTGNTTDTISFSFTSPDVNGSHFRYTILHYTGLQDQTSNYGEIIDINKNYTHIFQGARATGSFDWMSYWENDAADGSGKHHRFPPIKKLAADVAALGAGMIDEFGVSTAMALGLTFENIVIPSEIADKISYIGFAYAKRSSENKMFYGDSLVFNYHDHTASDHLIPTPLEFPIKDGYNDLVDASPGGSTYDKNYMYLDNFDILHNNVKVKISNIVPEYTITSSNFIGISFRSTETGFEFLRGTYLDPQTTKTVVASLSLTGYSADIVVDYNSIIPTNILFDPDLSFDMTEVGPFVGTDPRIRPKPTNEYSTLGKVDNVAGQKHIYLHLDSAYDFPIGQANLGTIVNGGTSLTDDSGTSYAFSNTSPNGYITNDIDFTHAVASIYAMKDSVYIDPKSQVIIPFGNPIPIDGAGVYSAELKNIGDCTISEKVTLFTGDPFFDTDGVFTGIGGLTFREARNQLENHSQGSSLRMANKISFKHLTYGISDLNRIYRKDNTDPQAVIVMNQRKGNKTFEFNPYIPPTYEYSNDYNAVQDLDTPQFVEETPEYNLNKLIRGDNYKNEDLDISNLKTFLVDNYHMMPTDARDVIAVRNIGDNLIIQQRYGLHYAFIKDFLNLQGANAYLGTGDLFDRNPVPIRFGNTDPVNCGNILSTLVFRHGYVVFDDIERRLYMFNGKELTALSNQYAENFFRENYNFDNLTYNPQSSIGNGVVLAYNGQHETLNILKRVYNGTHTNLSFSFSINNFLSFHEWLPSYILNNESSVFSYQITGKLYRHNDASSVCKFHYSQSTPNKSILDIIFTGGEQHKGVSKLFESIDWESQAMKLDDGVNVYNKTFDDIMIYNDDQCSDYVSLVNTNWFNKVKRSIIKTWIFNEFRDLVVDNLSPFFSSIKEPNSNVSSDKNWFKKSMFTGKYIVVRFRMNNDIESGTQHNIIINNMNVNAKINKR